MKIDLSNHIVELIDKYHESKAEQPRAYLGASLLGHECSRYLWYTFRWAYKQTFPGRVLRLFRRGQMEEETIVSDLRAIGVDMRYVGTHQLELNIAPHLGGHPDGVAVSGVPTAKKTPHITEFKTHNKKSFDDLVKNGVEKAKFMHYIQMQIYTRRKALTRALYYAICKDDDRVYTERIKLDIEVADKYIKRGVDITLAEHAPSRMSENPTWYQCKWCPAYDLCHKSKLTKEVNCRTCAHSTALSDGTWKCEKWDDIIPTEFQHKGCRSHVLHPDLVPWEMEPVDEWNCSYDGKTNGEDGVSSLEIIYGVIGKVASEFDGTIESGEGSPGGEFGRIYNKERDIPKEVK